MADDGVGSWRSGRGIAVAVVLAVAVLVVDPAAHLNGPDADWFGRSLSDGSLN